MPNTCESITNQRQFLFFIFLLIHSLLLIMHHLQPTMLKEPQSKKQLIQAKINAKLANLKEKQKQMYEHREHEQEESESQCSDYEDLEDIHQVDQHEEIIQNFKQSTINLNRYLRDYKNQEDSQFLHKLLFDFFKAQAIFQNLEEDKNNSHIYTRYQENEMKKITRPPQPQPKKQAYNFHQFTQIETKPSNVQKDTTVYEVIKDSQQKRMTMKDKLQSGKFCSFDHIPQYGEIQDYKSISSEDQILEQDHLENLICTMKKRKGSDQNGSRYGRRKEKDKDEKDGKKGRGRGRTPKKQQIAQQKKSSPQKSDEDKQKYKYRAKSESPVRKILYPSHHSKKNLYKTINDDDDSSNQANCDSQQSDLEQNDEQSEQEYSDEDSETEGDFQTSIEDFKHLDIYEEMDFIDDIDYALNQAIHGGKQKKIHGLEQYHFMKKSEKDKYFRKLTKQYQSDLKKAKQERKKQKNPKEKPRRNQQRGVSFNDTIYYKKFNADAKPNDVKITDERQEVLVKAIWEYDDQ